MVDWPDEATAEAALQAWEDANGDRNEYILLLDERGIRPKDQNRNRVGQGIRHP